MLLKLDCFKPLLRFPSSKELLLSLTLFFVCFVPAQNFEAYKPLKCEGPVPELFTQYAKNRAIDSANASKARGGTKFERRVLTEYNVSNIFFLDQMLSSGRITYGDEVTKYLNKVLDTILLEQTELRKSLSIFTLRSTSANAFITGYGYIFVTTGLLARLHNESELAYILCHEISHYTHKHSFEATERSEKLKSDSRFNFQKFEEGIKKLYQFSRENELEADREGLKLYLTTRYADSSSIKSLMVLDSLDNPFLTSSRLNRNFIETSKYKLSSDLNTKISKKMLNKVVVSDEDEEELDSREVKTTGRKSNKKESEEIESAEDYSTHPELSKRISILRKLLDTVAESRRANLLFCNGESEFTKINKIACYETVYLTSIFGQLGNAIYLTVAIEEKYGHNEFISKIKAICIYKSIMLKMKNAELERLGFAVKNSEGNWREFFATFTCLKKKEFIAVMLKNLYDLKKSSNNEFVSKLWKLAATEVGGTKYFTVDDYYKYYSTRKDSLSVNENAGYLGMLGENLKEIDFTDQIFIVRSSDESEEISVDRYSYKKRSRKRNVIDFDKTVLISPSFYQNSIRKNKSNSSKLINTAEVKEQLNESLNTFKNKESWNYSVLGTGSNPNITTDEINQYASLIDWLDETFSSLIQAESNIKLERITADNLSDNLKDKKHLALSSILYYKYFENFNSSAMCLSAVTIVFVPVYLYWQLRPKYIQSYNVWVFSLETGQFEAAYNRKFKGRLTKDKMNAHLYNMLYSIKRNRK